MEEYPRTDALDELQITVADVEACGITRSKRKTPCAPVAASWNDIFGRKGFLSGTELVNHSAFSTLQKLQLITHVIPINQALTASYTLAQAIFMAYFLANPEGSKAAEKQTIVHISGENAYKQLGSYGISLALWYVVGVEARTRRNTLVYYMCQKYIESAQYCDSISTMSETQCKEKEHQYQELCLSVVISFIG